MSGSNIDLSTVFNPASILFAPPLALLCVGAGEGTRGAPSLKLSERHTLRLNTIYFIWKKHLFIKNQSTAGKIFQTLMYYIMADDPGAIKFEDIPLHS